MDSQPVDYPTFTLETDGRLRHADGHLDMLPRRLALPLKALMDARGRTVTKDVLINTCWPRIEISEQSLARAIADLRKLLKRHGQDPIKTVYGVGYRLDAPIRADSVRTDSSEEPNALKARFLHQEALLRIHTRRPASLNVAERLLKEAAGLREDPIDWLNIALVHLHRMQLGYTTVSSSWPHLRSAAERAMKEFPAEALSLLALGYCWVEWDFPAAEEMLERARQIEPNSYTVNRCAGLKEQMVGHHDLAEHYFRKALEANPMALPASASLVITMAIEGRYSDAFAEIQQMDRKDPESPLTLGFRAFVETRLGDPAIAVTPAVQAFEALPASPLFAAILAYALSATGQNEAAREVLGRPSADGEAFENSNSLSCWTWLRMENPRRALKTLQYGLECRCSYLPIVLRDPMMLPISDNRQFQEIFHKVFGKKHLSISGG